ncbi:unnamed protein product [Blepharisma stoltei]|uniref:Uncharacterized protein n=1 Tax=Blepharisma stoltei TaxID=1481888 RepID=A0AAU9K0B2_9CILI|nr:unnamed protein product [Blepharisma stoltei]
MEIQVKFGTRGINSKSLPLMKNNIKRSESLKKNICPLYTPDPKKSKNDFMIEIPSVVMDRESFSAEDKELKRLQEIDKISKSAIICSERFKKPKNSFISQHYHKFRSKIKSKPDLSKILNLLNTPKNDIIVNKGKLESSKNSFLSFLKTLNSNPNTTKSALPSPCRGFRLSVDRKCSPSILRII